MKVYTSQKIRLNFDFQQNITGYSAVVVNVRLPDQTTTTWTPTVLSATDGTIYYDASGTTLSQAGWYAMQPVYTLSGGDYPGKTAYMMVYSRYE